MLSKGQPARDHTYSGEILIEEEALEIGMKMVKPKTRIIYPKTPLPLLEKTMEDHGIEQCT